MQAVPAATSSAIAGVVDAIVAGQYVPMVELFARVFAVRPAVTIRTSDAAVWGLAATDRLLTTASSGDAAVQALAAIDQSLAGVTSNDRAVSTVELSEIA